MRYQHDYYKTQNQDSYDSYHDDLEREQILRDFDQGIITSEEAELALVETGCFTSEIAEMLGGKVRNA